MVKICPSILSCNLNNISDSIKDVLSEIKVIHLDVMDGIYVPKKTFGSRLVKEVSELVKPFNIYVDTHLMIDLNANYLKKINDFAEFSDGICFHYESLEDKAKINEILDFLANKKVDKGLSIEPLTDVNVLIPYLDKLDRILIMTVKSGKGGQELMKDCLNKVNNLRKMNFKGIIQVDGGVKLDNFKEVLDFDVDEGVIGSALVLDKKLSYVKLKEFNNSSC